jgi:kynurenine formamidase
VSQPLPAYRELPVRPDAPAGSSWGVWGDGDVFGTLNLLDEAAAARGARAIHRGAVFNLNLEMELPDPPLFGRPVFSHDVPPAGIASHDEISNWDTPSSSQWDGFRHVAHPVYGYYGGLASDEHGIHHWAQRGIAGRGVLADVARWRATQGRPISCGEADVIVPSELTATLAAQGVAIEPGDVLLVRTGWTTWYRSLDGTARRALAADRIGASCGLRPGVDLAALLWDLHVAAVAADNPAVEVTPFGAITDPQEMLAAFRDPARAADTFVHFRLLALLGIPLGELWDLDSLADDCARDGTYEFFLTSAPLNLHAGAASPANALAIK